MDLTGKTAIVTGGSRGIGRAICLELARLGANVVFSYAGNAAAAQETVELVEQTGATARAVQGDVTCADAAKELVDAAKELGGVDILVNNAGITRDKLAARMSEEDFDAVIATNLKGAFLMTKAVLRPMMRAKSGAIVNMASVVGIMGNAGQANYAASKAGLIGMTKSIAREVASIGIRVNAVAPGYIETDMTAAMPEAAQQAMCSAIPAARAGKPEDVAHAVAFLVSDEAAYITGQVLAVDGGMAM
ncbi:3-oxoacyl-[acyl-carrier-protein] reductase [Collinsella tanakaei]|uniref:3-oxoacyl-[acyl-carrier-protein] reductase n=1 Tax=Collinsella tanakaei TaxID=626935 RepID=UPI0025A3EA7C|nr:3-oxoacyl-[acyl-carrier-protein] reductase [Collinsella tanakaei]MDM8302266.1 3-oxoacyl-[acyl-carrier-protein] reductase [Collinsella tanakaei]